MRTASFKYPVTALFCLTLAASAEPTLLAQDTSPSTDAQQQAYRSSVAQENIRQQADHVQAEIGELSRELQLNGLDPAELAILNNTASNLKNLSAKEMQKVVDALQSASFATADHNLQRSMVTAYKGQQSISLQLKSLASAIAAEQEQREIPSRLEELITRQSANLRQTAMLGGATPDQLSAGQKNTHEVVTSEQQSIAGDIDLLQKLVSTKSGLDATAPGDNPAPDVLKALGSGTLQTTAAQAAQTTSAGPFPDAVTQQTAVRDQLSSLLRVALSKLDPATRLQQAKELLDQVLTDQNGLDNVEQQTQLDGATLAGRQFGLQDRTAVVNALLKPINQAVATQLDLTQHDMGDASTTLASARSPADAAPKQQTVVADLTKAESLLDQQIAATEKQEFMAPTDKLAALQQLKAAIDSAQKSPQVSASDLQKLGEQAAPLSSAAANHIANAADQAAKSQPDAGAIKQSLAQASDDVQKQEDALAAAAKQYQALADASNALSQAQQNAKDANQAIQTSPGNLTTAAHDLSQAANAVDQAQQAAQQGAQAAQQPNAGQQPDASQDGQQASPQQGDQKGQQPSTGQDGQQTAQQPGGADGKPPQSPPGAGADSKQTAQQAGGDGGKPPQAPPGAGGDSKQTAQQPGGSGGKPPQSPPGAGGDSKQTAQAGGPSAQQALQQAADALKNATNQAVQGQGAPAQSSDNQALAAMQAAQAGLQAQMAQLAQASDPSSASGPSQGESQNQSTTTGGLAAFGSSAAMGALTGSATGYAGPGQVVGSLKPKDRDAIAQYQAEKSPPDYAPEIQQYLKNLADDAAASETH